MARPSVLLSFIVRALSPRSLCLFAVVARLAFPRSAVAEPAGPHPGPLASCTDGALRTVADLLAAKKIANDTESLTDALHRAGGSYVFPRALVLSGKRIEPTDARSRATAWLQSLEHAGEPRCGAAVGSASGGDTWAIVAVDAEAELRPLPARVRVGAWITVEATAFVPARAAKVVVLGPSGPPRPVPTSLSGRQVKARASLDAPGAWLVQVLIDGDAGPRPALETVVFAGVEPWYAPATSSAPGEEVATFEARTAGQRANDTERLSRMIDAARATEGLVLLARDDGLDALAQAHAVRMMRAKKLAHDLRDGDPAGRVQSGGIAAREIGENVAHAASLALAHRALWGSPSHRGNLLGERFDRVGLGVATDTDGTVWVTELFASSR